MHIRSMAKPPAAQQEAFCCNGQLACLAWLQMLQAPVFSPGAESSLLRRHVLMDQP